MDDDLCPDRLWLGFVPECEFAAVWINPGRNGQPSRLTAAFNPLLLEKQSFAVGLSLLGLAFFLWGERHLVTDQPLASRDFPVKAQLIIFAAFALALIVALSSEAIPFLYF